jgi:hypothetical protein
MWSRLLAQPRQKVLPVGKMDFYEAGLYNAPDAHVCPPLMQGSFLYGRGTYDPT